MSRRNPSPELVAMRKAYLKVWHALRPGRGIELSDGEKVWPRTPELYRAIWECLSAGIGVNETRKATGCDREMVVKIRNHMRRARAIGPCPCGQPSDHGNWCIAKALRNPRQMKILKNMIEKKSLGPRVERANLAIVSARKACAASPPVPRGRAACKANSWLWPYPETARFVRVWKSSKSVVEVARKLGITTKSAALRAVRLRKRGVELQRMTVWAGRYENMKSNAKP